MESPILRVVDAGSAPARSAMTEYFAELAARFPAGFEPGDALDEAVTSLNPPRGVFVLALVEDEPAGCGGAQFLDGETAEVKRMWVSPVHRGVGLGRRLLAHLEGEARRAGRRRIVLDTNASLTEAINLYRSCGYAPTDRYNANPYADRWFVKELPGGGSPALPTPASGEGPLPSAPFE